MMGKYIRKCKGMGEVAVMEVAQVGVRTRARTLAMETASASASAAKRRKIGSEELQFSSSYIQLRSGRGLEIMTENAISPQNSENSGRVIPSSLCSSPCSQIAPASTCSSNGSSELVDEKSMRSVVDLEAERIEIENSTCFDFRERRETTPSSGFGAESDDLESTERPSEAISRRRSTVDQMPSEEEINEFFSVAERDEQKRFAQKYNYDIAKDVPLEGRYEWVRLKP